MDEPSSPEDGSPASDGSPKVLNNLKGWIGGTTAVVIALAGLSQAVLMLMPDKAAEPQAALGEDVAATTEEPATADAAATEALPLLYDTSDGGTLYFKDGMWTLYDAKAESDQSFETLSRDDGKTVVANHDRTTFLRWPNEGGMAEQSVDDRVSWSELAFLSVPEPEKAPG